MITQHNQQTIVQSAIEAFGLMTHHFSCAMEQLSYQNGLPSTRYRPRLFIDGDQWCALYGDNAQDGASGFGKSPELAMYDFDANWCKKLEVRP